MANMLSEVYDALIAAGAPEEKARKAAEAVSNTDSSMIKLTHEQNLIRWMLGVNIVITLAVLGKVLTLH